MATIFAPEQRLSIQMDYTPAGYEICDEAGLVRKAQAGVKPAFDRLAARWRPTLVALAISRTGDLDAASDIAQEALVRAWVKLPALHDPSSFGPWLKTITINACASCRRRVGIATVPITDLAEASNLAESGLTPLDLLLLREREEAISSALLRLPEAKRSALIAHIWEGMAYREIADSVGVSANAVDNSLRRAKARLRELLADSVCVTADAERRLISTKRRQGMVGTNKKTATAEPALAAFIDQLATLIETGIPIDQALEALQNAPAPYAPVARDMRQEIESEAFTQESQYHMPEAYYLDQLHNPDAYPKLVRQLQKASEAKTALLPTRSQALSKAMASRPALFSVFLTDLVHAGEVRGMLDITLRRAQALLDRDWELACRRPKGEPIRYFLAGAERPNDWDELSGYQQRHLLAVTFRTFGALLVSGVPILQTMQTIGDLLPTMQSAGWEKARDAVKSGDPMMPALKEMAIFPTYSLALIDVGEEGGFLDTSLDRAADLVEREIARSRLAAGG